jgi:3',5'-cyclic AMP phosphodiesterase CpdA
MKQSRVKIYRNMMLLVATLALALAGHMRMAQADSRAVVWQAASAVKLDIRIPLQEKSVRFAVIGDSGTGDRAQYEVAQRMEAYWQATKFDFVIMLGDNIYGSHSPKDFVKKFEQPYKPLLDAGVKFYASLGNHDDPDDERLYKPFNMGGERYYAFRKGDVAFFALDSNYMDPKQLSWLDQNLKNSQGTWKICFFHHPLYNDGRHHGPDADLRTQVLPLFQRYGVNAVFSGHEHVYQRIKPENNIYYFVLGNSGKLMTHDFGEARERVKGFDSDQSFMLVEIAGDKLYFQTISRSGETIDSGELPRIHQ